MFKLIPLLVLLPLVNAACYAPNGNLEPNTAYQPCINVEGINSMCCALNRTIVGGTADRCTQNGLCVGADGTSWRGFCTDKNWASPGCLPKDICADTTGGTSAYSNQLIKCEDGTYCCGGNTRCCTSTASLKFTLNPTLISIKTATVASSSTSTSATAQPPSPSDSNSNPSPTCIPSTADLAITKGTSATMIGIGVGIPLATLALIGSILGFWYGQKRGRRTHIALASKEGLSTSGMVAGQYQPFGEIKVDGGYYAPPSTMDQERLQEVRVQELRGQQMPVELAGAGRT